VVQKNAPTSTDYNYDPVQSILIIFFWVDSYIPRWFTRRQSPILVLTGSDVSILQLVSGLVASISIDGGH